jgi:hypothetical protein
MKLIVGIADANRTTLQKALVLTQRPHSLQSDTTLDMIFLTVFSR